MDTVIQSGTRMGPTFARELEAAGLLGAPVAWTEDGTILLGDLSPAQRTALDAVIEAHDPAAPLPPSDAEAQRAALVAHLTQMEQDATLPAALRDLAPLLRQLVG